MKIGPITLPFGKTQEDPYWDAFINRPPVDSRNAADEILRHASGGAVNPRRVDLHTPEITTAHLKQLATFLGAEQVGIVRLKDAEPHDPTDSESYPFAIVCTVKADYDPRTAPGIGGQVPVRNGRYVTFILASYIREMGYRATNQEPGDAHRLAVAAGLGTLSREGRLVPATRGAHIHVADEVVYTDLPLAPEGEG